jgi:hypothetical protein
VGVAPQTWHHGLVAMWWAEFNEGGDEVEYFRGFVERPGESVLDVACGTGRLLVPYRQAGLDVPPGGEVSPERAHEHHDQDHQPDDHVRAVEAGDRVEQRPVRIVGERDPMLHAERARPRLAHVLQRLQPEERDA